MSRDRKHERMSRTLAWLGAMIGVAAGALGQDASAADQATTVALSGQVSSTLSEVTGGDRARYREDHQVRDGFSGGLDWLLLDAQRADWSLASTLRALNEEDLALSNYVTYADRAYLKQEASVYPRYYDASNRFYSTAPFRYDLDTTLRTLRGDVGLEIGSLGDEGPRTFLGYRHRSRDGETDSHWGAWLRNASPDDFILFVQPLERKRNEDSSTAYLGATHQWAGWGLGARQAVSRFEGVETYVEPGYYNDGTAIFNRSYRNAPRHTTWTTNLNAEREALDGDARVRFDYQYAATQTDSTTDVDSFTPAGARHYGEHSLNYNVADHAGRSHSQTTGVRLDYNPQDWVRVWAGGKFLTGKSVGTSTRGEEGAEAAAVDNDASTADEIWASKAINREIGWREEVGVEVNALPNTRVALDFGLDQSRVKYDWAADVSGSRNSGSDGDWSWLSTIWEHRNTYTASVRNWSLRRLPISGRYRYRIDTADVDDQVDIANTKTGDPEYTETTTAFYYPGRIEDWRRGTHEFLFSTTVKAHPRLTASPSFAHRSSHYEVSNDPVPEISAFRSNTVSVGLMAQPVDALSCTFNLARQFALTSTRADSFSNTILSPNSTWYGGLTPDFNASYTSLNGEVAYAWEGLTPFTEVGLVDGNGDFDTTLVFGGVGIKGALRRVEGGSWQTAYRFYDYHEDENGGINDYTAHGLFLTVRMPFDIAS